MSRVKREAQREIRRRLERERQAKLPPTCFYCHAEHVDEAFMDRVWQVYHRDGVAPTEAEWAIEISKHRSDCFWVSARGQITIVA